MPLPQGTQASGGRWWKVLSGGGLLGWKAGSVSTTSSTGAETQAVIRGVRLHRAVERKGEVWNSGPGARSSAVGRVKGDGCWGEFSTKLACWPFPRPVLRTPAFQGVPPSDGAAVGMVSLPGLESIREARRAARAGMGQKYRGTWAESQQVAVARGRV